VGSSRTVRISLPLSKSISNRILLLEALSGGVICPDAVADSTDTTRLKELLYSNDYLLDAGDGGTTLRFLLPRLALGGKERMLTGTPRMRKRPVSELVDALNSIGADITYAGEAGYPPLKVGASRVGGGEVTVDTSRSSQFVSALLLAAPFLPGGLVVTMKGDRVSASYVQMTLHILERAGIKFFAENDRITISHQHVSRQVITVERDWSSAAFWYELAALRPDLSFFLEGLTSDGVQGDAVAVVHFERLGVFSRMVDGGMMIGGRADHIPQDSLEFDLSSTPDLAPVLVVACFARKLPAVFNGISHLRYKESDRMALLEHYLTECGARVFYDGLKFELLSFSERSLPVLVDPHDDHRLAMAFGILGFCQSGVTVSHPEVVRKSYPDFWNQLAKCNVTQASTGAEA
jgi:3-phosphoshikimate 1-carboxyvinyltransferase